MRPDGYDEAAYHQQNDILTDRSSGIITFMTYLYCWIRIPIQFQTANQMAALHCAGFFILHGVGLRFLSQLSSTEMESGSESESASENANLVFHREPYSVRSGNIV